MSDDTWDIITTWNLVLPPSRPSAHHLAIVRALLVDRDRSLPVAVLGSTPEFRDLLCEEGFARVNVLDRNTRFYRAMTDLRTYRSDESLVLGDWLETLPALTDTFSFILSDLTMGNVPYERRRDFYRSISRALLPNGIFIDKVLTHPFPHLPISWVLEKYRLLPFNLLHLNYFSCEAFFCSDLLDLDHIVDTTRFYENLTSRATNPRITAFLKAMPHITPPGCLWFYGRRWPDLEADYFRYLDLKATFDDEPTSPYYGRLRLLVTSKR